MRKTVPVVVYENGDRKVIGDAVVEDGPGLVTVDANIFADHATSIFAGLEAVTLKSFSVD